MITGITTEGFNFEVNENIGKDFRIVIALRKLNSDDDLKKVEGTYDYAEAVLGKSGVEALVNFTIDKIGYADTEFIISQIHEIVGEANEKSAEIKKS